jgi:hypothetical protein
MQDGVKSGCKPYSVHEPYEWVVIDCPPALGIWTLMLSVRYYPDSLSNGTP